MESICSFINAEREEKKLIINEDSSPRHSDDDNIINIIFCDTYCGSLVKIKGERPWWWMVLENGFHIFFSICSQCYELTRLVRAL
jgi:hypothetical protein